MVRRWTVVVLTFSIVIAACGGPLILTEKRILEWGHPLNLFMATNFEAGNAYPESLDELDPIVADELKKTDGWGNPLLYRRLRVDKYNLISAGSDGEFGNSDDVVMENGALKEASKIYSEHPLKR
jgi:hypothetical protein